MKFVRTCKKEGCKEKMEFDNVKLYSVTKHCDKHKKEIRNAYTRKYYSRNKVELQSKRRERYRSQNNV